MAVLDKVFNKRAIKVSKPDVALLSRQAIIASLLALKDDLELGAKEAEIQSVFDLEVSAGHLLYDLCSYMGLTEEEIKTILGEEINA